MPSLATAMRRCCSSLAALVAECRRNFSCHSRRASGVMRTVLRKRISLGPRPSRRRLKYVPAEMFSASHNSAIEKERSTSSAGLRFDIEHLPYSCGFMLMRGSQNAKRSAVPVCKGLKMERPQKGWPACFDGRSMVGRGGFRLGGNSRSSCFYWRSLGDSNPCFRRERATSWAARRRELCPRNSLDQESLQASRAPVTRAASAGYVPTASAYSGRNCAVRSHR